MNSELKKMLDWVWDERETIMSKAPAVNGDVKPHMIGHSKNNAVDYIYDYYKKATKNAVSKNRGKDGELGKFQRRLIEVKNKLNGCTLQIQGNQYVQTRDANDNDILFLLPNDVRKAFYHFRRRPGSATHRIYLNIKEHGRLRAFLNVAHRVWDVDGFLNAKVSGPGNPRADSAVLYFSSLSARSEGLAAIYNWIFSHPEHFNVEVPKLTKRVTGLTGVSLGMEPPKKHLIKINNSVRDDVYAQRESRQSFGTYRCTVIFMALENSERPSRYSWKSHSKHKKFNKRAETYFKAAGIDPERPWLQDNAPLNTVMMVPATQLKQKIDRAEAQLR